MNKMKNIKEEFDLSEKIHYEDCVTPPKPYMLFVEDVKEFIARIKASMLFTPSPKERGEFIVWLGKEINHRAGEKLCQ